MPFTLEHPGTSKTQGGFPNVLDAHPEPSWSCGEFWPLNVLDARPEPTPTFRGKTTGKPCGKIPTEAFSRILPASLSALEVELGRTILPGTRIG